MVFGHGPRWGALKDLGGRLAGEKVYKGSVMINL